MKFKKVILNAEVQSKEELFQLIANMFAQEGVVEDNKKFIDALNEREAAVTTGLIDEIAIPHGRSDTVNSNEILVITLKDAIQYETLDGSDVKYVFALAITPSNNHQIETLMELSTKLMDQDFVKQFKQATTSEEIVTLFN